MVTVFVHQSWWRFRGESADFLWCLLVMTCYVDDLKVKIIEIRNDWRSKKIPDKFTLSQTYKCLLNLCGSTHQFCDRWFVGTSLWLGSQTTTTRKEKRYEKMCNSWVNSWEKHQAPIEMGLNLRSYSGPALVSDLWSKIEPSKGSSYQSHIQQHTKQQAWRVQQRLAW